MDFETEIIQRMVKKLPLEVCEMIVNQVIEIQNRDFSEYITCYHCGRVWDGNAQCYPCVFYE